MLYLVLNMTDVETGFHFEMQLDPDGPKAKGTLQMKTIVAALLKDNTHEDWCTLKEDNGTPVCDLKVSVTLPESPLLQFAEDHFPELLMDAVVSISGTDGKARSAQQELRTEAIDEFLFLEREYVGTLRALLHTFREPLVERGLLTDKEAGTIFLNVSEIYRFHNQFLLQLEMEHTTVAQVGRLLVELTQGMDIYGLYCRGSSDAVILSQTLQMERPEFREFLREDRPEWRGRSLFSHLLAPVQALNRYPSLILRILERTPEHVPGYAEMLSTHRILEQLSAEVQKEMQEQEVLSASRDAWKKIEQAPACEKFLRYNMPLVNQLSQFSQNTRTNQNKPRVVATFPVSYSKDSSASQSGTLILFENSLLLASSKDSKALVQVETLVPLISLNIEDHKGQSLVTTSPLREVDKAKQLTEAASKKIKAEQDTKEISYLVSKFMRFERIFFDEIVTAREALLRFRALPETTEVATATVLSITRLKAKFYQVLDRVEGVLLNNRPEKIEWLVVYKEFLGVLPLFKEFGVALIELLPHCYQTSVLQKIQMTETQLVALFNNIFAIVEHVPAYDRSAKRILHRIPANPQLPQLLTTYRSIEGLVMNTMTLRERFDANVAVLAITRHLDKDNVFAPDRVLLHSGRLRDFDLKRSVRLFLFNDLVLICKGSTSKENLRLQKKMKLDAIEVVQLSPTSFQLMNKKDSESLCILESSRPSRCDAWLSQFQSAMRGLTADKPRYSGLKSLEMTLWDTVSTKWSLSWPDNLKYHEVLTTLNKTYTTFIEQVFIQSLPSVLDTLPGDATIPDILNTTEGNRDTLRQAQGEFLRVCRANDNLTALNKHQEDYSDLRSYLQGAAVNKHQVHKERSIMTDSMDPSSARLLHRASSSGVSLGGTIRKKLKIKW